MFEYLVCFVLLCVYHGSWILRCMFSITLFLSFLRARAVAHLKA